MNMQRLRLLRLVAGVWVLLLTLIMLSCSGLSHSKDNPEGLADAVESFNGAMRWGEYKQAAVWIGPQFQDSFWSLADELSRYICITAYEVRNIWLSEDKSTGNVTLLYQFYSKKDPNIRKKSIQQEWQFHPREKVWQIVQHDLQQLVP